MSEQPVPCEAAPAQPAKPRKGITPGVVAFVGAAVIITSSACGPLPTGSKAPAGAAGSAAPAAHDTSSPAPSPTPTGPEMTQTGSAVEISQDGSDAASVTVQSVKITTEPSDPEFGEAPKNGYYAIATVTIRTVGQLGSPFSINPLDFYVLTGGRHYDMGDGNSFEALDSSESLDATDLNGGETASGEIPFDVPSPHGEIVYAPNPDTGPVAEWKF